MTQQYLRACRLDGGGRRGKPSTFRSCASASQVDQHTLQTPNVGDITISNLSDATAQRIKGEGTLVTLEAGYQSGYGLIFKGQIIQKRTGRENPVDTYLNILAQGGDQAYNHAVVNKSLAAGHTYKDQVMAAYEVMKPYRHHAGLHC
jgi:hypothetical protein